MVDGPVTPAAAGSRSPARRAAARIGAQPKRGAAEPQAQGDQQDHHNRESRERRPEPGGPHRGGDQGHRQDQHAEQRRPPAHGLEPGAHQEAPSHGGEEAADSLQVGHQLRES